MWSTSLLYLSSWYKAMKYILKATTFNFYIFLKYFQGEELPVQMPSSLILLTSRFRCYATLADD